MTENYCPPKVWQWNEESGGKFSSINRPTSGATHEASLPSGQHNLQLYSLATPNGVKVTVLLEELLEAGHTAAEYDAYPINILEGEQFGSGFCAVNPNSKIPALIDRTGKEEVRIFESGAILLYLAEKFEAFIPKKERTETLNWLFWQMASAPYLGGGFGHFYAYAPEKWQYPIDRFAMETKRQLDVLDKNLANRKFVAGNEYSIADIAIWPWYGALVMGELYHAGEFLAVHTYSHVQDWAQKIAERPAVIRGQLVTRTWGEEKLPERHSSQDFEPFGLT